MKRKIAKLFALLGVMVLLASCGGGGGGGGSSGSSSNAVSKWVANDNSGSWISTAYITFYADKTYSINMSGTLKGVEGYINETGTYTGNAAADGDLELSTTNVEVSPSWSGVNKKGSVLKANIKGDKIYFDSGEVGTKV